MRTEIPVLRVQGPQTWLMCISDEQRLVKRGITIINVQSETYFSEGTDKAMVSRLGEEVPQRRYLVSWSSVWHPGEGLWGGHSELKGKQWSWHWMWKFMWMMSHLWPLCRPTCPRTPEKNVHNSPIWTGKKKKKTSEQQQNVLKNTVEHYAVLKRNEGIDKPCHRRNLEI